MSENQAGTRPRGVFARAAAQRQARAPATARAVVLTVFVFLAAALGFAVVTPVKELVRAEGEIVPLGRLRQIEHVSGGVVLEVAAQEGQAVRAGDELAILEDPTLSRELRQTSQALLLVRLQLAALDGLRPGDQAPAGDAVTSVVYGDDALGGSRAHARAREEVHLSQQAVLSDRIDKMNATIATLEAAADVGRARVAEFEDQVARLEQLHERGHVSAFQLGEARDRLGDLRGELASAEVELARARADQRALEADRSLSGLSYREETLEKAHELRLEEARLLADLALQRDLQDALTIRAPVDGIIQSVAFPSVGEVIAADAEVFQLLPADARLVAEVRLKPADIGHVETGAEVNLKFRTFDARRFGGVAGRIESLSPTQVADPDGTVYFRATVALAQAHIGSGENQRALRPGMEVSAEIETRSRTVLEYILKPIDTSLRAAFSER